MNHNGLLCCTKKTGPGRLVPVGWGFVEVCRWCWRTGTGLWERHQLSKPRRFHSSVWCHFARCGNVHLHCSICSDIFLLASRYNKKKERKEILFQRKLYYLNNEDPHYKVGPKEGTQEKGAEAASYIASVFNQPESRAWRPFRECLVA